MSTSDTTGTVRTRPRRPYWALGLVIIGITALATFIAQSSQGAELRSADSTLIQVTVDSSSAAGLDGFSGSYGTAGTPDLSQPSGADDGDFSDPDGVLDIVQPEGTQVAATSWDSASGQLTARGNITALSLDFNGVEDFLTMGSVDAYASCVNGQAIIAYARNSGARTTVAGTAVTDASGTVIPVTGADLGLPNVATGVLTASITPFEKVVNQPTEASAEAYYEIKIRAVLKNADGDVIYSGLMIDLTVGHVKVVCQPRVVPSPSTSSASATTSPSIVPNSVTPSPSTESPTPSPSTASPSPTTPDYPTDPPTPPSPTSSSSSPAPPAPTGSTGTPPPNTDTPAPPNPPDDGDDDGLAVTGSTAVMIALSGMGVAMLGVGLLAFARHRRESRS